MKLVSILIPAFKPRHFEMALTSALAQTWPAKEVIVSDDCPTDEIERICALYPQVLYSRNPQRRPNANLRRLTNLASGEYLKYLMDDDILHPLCCSRMAEALGEDPRVKLVFSARDRIDADSRVVSRKRELSTAAEQARLPGEVLRKWILTRAVNPIGEFSTVMFRKADVVRADGEPIYLDYQGRPVAGLTDLVTFLQLCEAGDAVYISDALSFFRLHPAANTSNRGTPGFRAILADWAMLAEHLARDTGFSAEDRRLGLTRIRDALAGQQAVFDDLAPELDRLSALIRGVEAPP